MKGIIPNANLLANESPGYRMKYYRLQKGLTQKQLAEECGLTESAIRNYELGNRYPSMEHLTDIAYALDVSRYAISEPDISAIFGAIHVLFDLEKIYGIEPVVIDGKTYLEIPQGGKKITSSNAMGNMVKVWAKMRGKLTSGEIDYEAYINWQARYPERTDPIFEEMKKQYEQLTEQKKKKRK